MAIYTSQEAVGAAQGPYTGRVLWFAALTAAAAGPQQEVLENGLTVTVLSDPAMPHLVVQHWIESGSASDPPTHPGIAHLVEHLMVRDSGLEARIDTLGGTLSAYTRPTTPATAPR